MQAGDVLGHEFLGEVVEVGRGVRTGAWATGCSSARSWDAGAAGTARTTGWMGADLGQVSPGDVVPVGGAGAVGQVAARAAALLGAEQVVVIDRLPERLEQARTHMGVDALDHTATDVGAELRERTGGGGRTCARGTPSPGPRRRRRRPRPPGPPAG